MASSTGSAINARDFSDKVTDPNRDEWNSGAMHHLVKALNGSPVAIVLDKSTGFTEVNVTLGGVRQTPGYGTFQVLVQRVHSDGTTGGCWYPLFQVGTVIELGDSHARWTARESYRAEKSAAIRRLRDKMANDLATEHLDDFPAGEWEASVFPGFVHASFRPRNYSGPVRFTWTRYESCDLVTA